MNERLAGLVSALVCIVGVTLVATPVMGQPVADDFASPLFGLDTTPNGGLVVADFGAGIVEPRDGKSRLLAPLPGVTDVAPIGQGAMWAVTGETPEDPAFLEGAQSSTASPGAART